ncbi:MAG: hypothetical protein WA139_04080 [Candidatus Aenigmatarchaeota archaeon]
MKIIKFALFALFVSVFFSQAANAQKIIDVELTVFQNDTVAEKTINVTEGRYSQVWRTGDYTLEFLDGNKKIIGQQSIDISFGYSGPVALNQSKPDDKLFDSYFLSYRHPYNPEIKTVELLHFDNIIFSKNIDIAEYALPVTAAACNKNNVCEPEKGENNISCTSDCRFSGNADNSWIAVLSALIAVSAAAAIALYRRRKKEFEPGVAFEE